MVPLSLALAVGAKMVPLTLSRMLAAGVMAALPLSRILAVGV